MTVEEFEKATEQDLRQRANELFEYGGWPSLAALERIWVPHPCGLCKGGFFDFAFFLALPAAARAVHPAPSAFALTDVRSRSTKDFMSWTCPRCNRTFRQVNQRHACQRVRRSGLFAARINVRKAVLTDCSSGKCSATSGERSTRFVPAR
jgi:hypothetical protein